MMKYQNPWHDMRILITGINGFVGTNFTQDWKNRHTLYGLDINQTSKMGVEQIYTFEQMDEICSVDAIVHLAGKAHDTKNQSLANQYFEINTELTKKIFDFFLQSATETFIFFSSVKAAADSVGEDILTEDIVPNPIGPYGESKIKAEQYILSKGQEILKSNKKVYILRPCMIHGPGNKGNLNLLYEVVRKGIPWPLGAFDNKRSFCSIDNIAYVVEQLIIRKEIENGIYHICDDDTLTTSEIVNMIGTSIKRKPLIFNVPKKIINFLAFLGNLFHLPLNKERLQKLTENYVVSNNKIKKALDLKKMPVSARDGMEKTLQSFSINQ